MLLPARDRNPIHFAVKTHNRHYRKVKTKSLDFRLATTIGNRKCAKECWQRVGWFGLTREQSRWPLSDLAVDRWWMNHTNNNGHLKKKLSISNWNFFQKDKLTQPFGTTLGDMVAFNYENSRLDIVGMLLGQIEQTCTVIWIEIVVSQRKIRAHNCSRYWGAKWWNSGLSQRQILITSNQMGAFNLLDVCHSFNDDRTTLSTFLVNQHSMDWSVQTVCGPINSGISAKRLKNIIRPIGWVK